MRVLSKYRDYYDTVNVSYDKDELKFVRLTYVENFDHKLRKEISEWISSIHSIVKIESYKGYNLSVKIISFCEKLYLIFHFVKHTPYDSQVLDQVIFTSQEIMCMLNDKDLATFKKLLDKKFDLSSIHHEFDAVYFALRNRSIIIHPILKEFGFHKYMDAISCNQEIELYLSNILLKKDVEPKPITNDQKIELHGFDKKTSFRK